MADKTGIRWTDATWPVTTGCALVSPGCTHCYAMRQSATRLAHLPSYDGVAETRNGHPVWTGKVNLLHDRLGWPLRWTKPRMIFVANMSDLFWEEVPDAFIDQVFDVIERCPQHTFQILTKRPERMRQYMLRRWIAKDDAGEYNKRDLPNVWVGVSVEDQVRALQRIPVLLGTPAAVRFLSCEPLLGSLSLRPWLNGETARCDQCANEPWDDDCGCACHDVQGIHWVIVGGESGPRYRQMDLDWARQIRDDCDNASVPFFFKQSSGSRTEMGQTLDGRRWEQYPKPIGVASFA